MSDEDDITVLAKAIGDLASWQERLSKQIDRLGGHHDLLVDRVNDISKQVAAHLTALEALKKWCVDLEQRLVPQERKGQRGSLSRLGDVLFYAGVLFAVLGYWFGYNVTNGFQHQQDYLLAVFLCGLPLIMGWALRYVLSGKTTQG